MEAAFGSTDTEGARNWREAYEACEAAQLLFIRKHGPAMLRQASGPVALLSMLTRVATLLPTQTRRPQENQAFQQFSTPIGLGFVAAVAAAIVDDDGVLGPSAGTGLLAIHAEVAGERLALNELAGTRAGLLGWPLGS